MNDDTTRYHCSDAGILTPAEIARLDEIERRLADCDDISEISDSAWTAAVGGKHALAAARDTIAVRLDPDVQDLAAGQGSQTEVNRMLRERMVSEGV